MQRSALGASNPRDLVDLLITLPEGCPSENRIFGQMSDFWTKEGLFGQKRRVLGQKCRVLGQKGGFLDKSRIFGQDKFTDGQPSGIGIVYV